MPSTAYYAKFKLVPAAYAKADELARIKTLTDLLVAALRGHAKKCVVGDLRGLPYRLEDPASTSRGRCYPPTRTSRTKRCLQKIVILHGGIHSDISSSFATHKTHDARPVAKLLVLISEWMPQ